MKYILQRMKRFCGFITGVVFFLGGILKLMDPVGAGLVMKEYLDFLHIGFLSGIAKHLAEAFSLLETIIGITLITGVWRKTMAFAALGLQIFFTLLTLLLVIFNPEMDCGCFGEAIHLTHMQTFLKNIVLCALICIYIFPKSALGEPKARKYVSFSAVTIAVLLFAAYSWIYIPLVDFTDFKPATGLHAGSDSDTSVEDIYEAVFIYEKDGIQKEFGLDELPDSTWTYVSTETVMKSSTDHSEANLSFYDADGIYHDEMATDGKVMIVSVYDIDMPRGRWNRAAAFLDRAEAAGFNTLLLVASTPEEMQKKFYLLQEDTVESLAPHIYFSDYKTLITMNRSNSGVTYFSGGFLIRKWSRAARPSEKELHEIYSGDDTEVVIWHDTKGSLGLQGFLLGVFAIMLLL
jgi:uncharacterized membrane protein YphA (DoxX/SURF4 family)